MGKVTRLTTLLLVLFLAVGVAATNVHAQIRTVAVLDLQNTSGDENTGLSFKDPGKHAHH